MTPHHIDDDELRAFVGIVLLTPTNVYQYMSTVRHETLGLVLQVSFFGRTQGEGNILDGHLGVTRGPGGSAKESEGYASREA